MAFDAVTYAAAKGSSKTYTDTRIDTLIPGLTYKGAVATVAELPATGNQKGDAYNVTDGSGVYAWSGTAWGSASKVGPQGLQGQQGPQGQSGESGFSPIASVSKTGDTATISITDSTHTTTTTIKDGKDGSNAVSVSATGTSTSDVRYITIDGTESRFTSVALRAMKSAWVTGTTQNAATAILNDDSVVAGDGFLATVYWSDLPGGLTQAEVKAFVMKKSGSYQKIIQFECTSGTVAPYSWFYNSYERVWRSQVPLNNTVTSTSVDEALTANMGKELQDQVNNLKNIGRFLAIWNSATGLPLTDPVTTGTYTYRTGDYFRVGVVSSATPAVNYKPNGSSYTPGTASTTVETESVEVGWVYYYDGSQWLAQSAGGGGTVQDVQVNGTSIVASGTGIANITDAALANVKYTAQSLTDTQKTQARTNIGAIALEEYNSSATTFNDNTLYYVVE